MDVFDFAVQMETDAETLYHKLAAESPHPGIQEIFTGLAADEKRHKQIFQALKERQSPDTATDSKVLERAKNIFGQILSKKQEPPTAMANLDSYRYALSLEAEAVTLYSDAAKREPDGDLKKLLLRIAEEEQQHFNIVENIYNFVNAPNQYLAWREFSNLGEFRAFGRKVDM